MICNNCKLECPEGSKFCPNCGKPIEPTICSRCGSKIESKFKYCPNCGNEIKTIIPRAEIKQMPEKNPSAKAKTSWFSWRRVGAILSLFWGVVNLAFCSSPMSFLVGLFIAIRLLCGIIGLKSESKAPAIIIIFDLLLHMVISIQRARELNYYSSLYNLLERRPFDFGNADIGSIILLFSLWFIPAFMMLVTPRDYKNNAANNHSEDSENQSGFILNNEGNQSSTLSEND